jgi:hypothetical protein
MKSADTIIAVTWEDGATPHLVCRTATSRSN